MAYYPVKPGEIISTREYKHVAFDVGDKEDTYSIRLSYHHNVDTDEVTHRAQVETNWSSKVFPSDSTQVKEGQRYSRILFEGTLKQCYDFIDKAVAIQGYWTDDPKAFFGKIFIEPTV